MPGVYPGLDTKDTKQAVEPLVSDPLSNTMDTYFPSRVPLLYVLPMAMAAYKLHN